MGARLGSSNSKRGGRRRAHSVMSDINVTPMVDVMLVLLVIFMITAPMLSTGVAVNLPKAHAKALGQKDSSPLEVSIDKKGIIYMGDSKVKLARLKGILLAIAEESPDRRVYIKADSSLSYGQVMGLMAAVSSSGFTKIALVTDPSSVSN